MATHLKIGAQATITDKNQIRDYLSAGSLFVDRGYTSHEHFAEVGLIHMNGRLYDPLLRRFLNADENIQHPHNTQNYNKYGYVMNNPLLYSDPSGEIFWFAALAVAFKSIFWAGVVSGAIAGAIVGAATYMISAAISGAWSWGAFGKSILMGAVTGAIAGGYNPQIFCSSAGTLMNMAGQVISSVLPAWNISIGDFDFSISPSIAIGKGWGFGANISATFHAGDFSLSSGFGIMNYAAHAGSGTSGWEYRKSLMASYDDGKFGISAGTNIWSGLHDQQTGITKMRYGDFGFSYENDGKPFSRNLGDGGDSYRTAAASISIGEFSVGINLFTGKRDQMSYDNENFGDWDLKKGELGLPTIRNGIKYKYGLVDERGPRYRLGAAYFAYKNFRIGIDSDRHVRHTIQNRWIHNAGFAAQRAFEVRDFSIKPYFQYQTKNMFTTW